MIASPGHETRTMPMLPAWPDASGAHSNADVFAASPAPAASVIDLVVPAAGSPWLPVGTPAEEFPMFWPASPVRACSITKQCMFTAAHETVRFQESPGEYIRPSRLKTRPPVPVSLSTRRENPGQLGWAPCCW